MEIFASISSLNLSHNIGICQLLLFLIFENKYVYPAVVPAATAPFCFASDSPEFRVQIEPAAVPAYGRERWRRGSSQATCPTRQPGLGPPQSQPGGTAPRQTVDTPSREAAEAPSVCLHYKQRIGSGVSRIFRAFPRPARRRSFGGAKRCGQARPLAPHDCADLKRSRAALATWGGRPSV